MEIPSYIDEYGPYPRQSYCEYHHYDDGNVVGTEVVSHTFDANHRIYDNYVFILNMEECMTLVNTMNLDSPTTKKYIHTFRSLLYVVEESTGDIHSRQRIGTSTDICMTHYRNGVIHRLDDPALFYSTPIVTIIQYMNDGKRHRAEGPAITIIRRNGNTKKIGHYFYVDDELHRTDGPAVIISVTSITLKSVKSSKTYYYVRNKLHRLDGPSFTIRKYLKDGVQDVEEKWTKNNELFRIEGHAHIRYLEQNGKRKILFETSSRKGKCLLVKKPMHTVKRSTVMV